MQVESGLVLDWRKNAASVSKGGKWCKCTYGVGCLRLMESIQKTYFLKEIWSEAICRRVNREVACMQLDFEESRTVAVKNKREKLRDDNQVETIIK